MYTKYFGLSEKPFSITPDPHFLFLSERHAEALAHLVYGVTESGGFIQLTGEVGTGKTTLTRSLLERLPEAVDLAVILNPRLSVIEFLHAIFDELNIETPEGAPTTRNMVDALNRYLLRSHSEGRRTVLLVDEAQNLDSDVLEQLRLLTNLETSKDKLLQIILVGQPELRALLGRNDLRQLAQRITGRYHLQTLDADETIAYVRHRLQVAGAQQDIFTPGALWEVHRLSGGVPRLINVICDRSLLGAFTAENPRIDRRTVQRAASEVSGVDPPKRKLSMRMDRLAVGAAAVVLLAFGLWGLSQVFVDNQDGAIDHADPAVADTAGISGATPTLSRAFRVSERLAPLETTANAAETVTRVNASLADLLADPGVNTGTDGAFRQLFLVWDLPRGNPRQPPCARASRAGLKCAFQVGSWRLLRTMNRPAILSLVDGAGSAHNTLLVAVGPDSATLRAGDREYQLAIADISRFWLGEYLVLWRPQHGDEDLLLPGTRSDGIVWLRQALGQIQGIGRDSLEPAYFDRALHRQVSAFQRSRRLEADGKAGVQTLIAINTAMNIPSTPYLERP